MAVSALAAVKELLDSDSFLSSIRATAEAETYFQKAPDGTDLTTGAVIVLDHRGEEWDRLTESRQKRLTFGIVAFANSFQLLDQRIVPAIINIVDDMELYLTIDNCLAYNLEIAAVREGLEDYRDKNTNNVFSADVECVLEYVIARKGSANDIPEGAS